ncbi:MAG: hypothetical protein ISEC1_P0265 [Thiomicrorhabdus sp.]|nr:MAG: hypothetical protein ISEC1_P0265 [Thiomicrorhabdus sp.]
MTNNDILRRMRYSFDLDDNQVIKVFSLVDHSVSREQISFWLKKDDDDEFVTLEDIDLARFLNGFINLKRGKKEGEQPQPEQRLTHNLIFMKLKIALQLQADDVLNILLLADFRLSKHELSAFFRKPGHKHYRECKDQVLRNFLNGLQKKFRPETEAKA